MKQTGARDSDGIPGPRAAGIAGRHDVTAVSPTDDAVTAPGGGVSPQFGGYQLETELGRGATGIVYCGKDLVLGRAVAIKTLAIAGEPAADGLPEAREIFRREAAIARRLRHPHIVAIYDAGDAPVPYIAMELVPGADLTRYVRPAQLLPLPRVMRIVARVAAALHYAHVNGVVHGDIKPSNVLFEPATDTVKVTDFGIARSAEVFRATTGRPTGTPHYMSPEQLVGQDIDARSDLFSLGVMFYQLATGHLPFPGESLPQRVVRTVHEPHTDILTYNAKLPSCLAGIIDKALAKQPAGRYQTGDAMAQAIEACAAAMCGAGQRTARAAAPREAD